MEREERETAQGGEGIARGSRGAVASAESLKMVKGENGRVLDRTDSPGLSSRPN